MFKKYLMLKILEFMKFKYINFLSFNIFSIFSFFNASTRKSNVFFHNEINENVKNQNYKHYEEINQINLLSQVFKNLLTMNIYHVEYFFYQIELQKNYENELSYITKNSKNKIFKPNLLIFSYECPYSAIFKLKNISSNDLIFFSEFIYCKYDLLNKNIDYLEQYVKIEQLELELVTIFYLRKIFLDSKSVKLLKIISRSFLVLYELFIFYKEILTKIILFQKEIFKDLKINYINCSKLPKIFYICKNKMLHENNFTTLIIVEMNKKKITETIIYSNMKVLYSTENILNNITINSKNNKESIFNDKEGFILNFLCTCIPFFCNSITCNIFGKIKKFIDENIVSCTILKIYFIYNFYLKTSYIQILKFNMFTFIISKQICRMAINNTEYTSGDFDDMVKDNEPLKYYKSLDLLPPRPKRNHPHKKQMPTNNINDQKAEINNIKPKINSNDDVNTESPKANTDKKWFKNFVKSLVGLAVSAFVISFVSVFCFFYFK